MIFIGIFVLLCFFKRGFLCYTHVHLWSAAVCCFAVGPRHVCLNMTVQKYVMRNNFVLICVNAVVLCSLFVQLAYCVYIYVHNHNQKVNGITPNPPACFALRDSNSWEGISKRRSFHSYLLSPTPHVFPQRHSNKHVKKSERTKA